MRTAASANYDTRLIPRGEQRFVVLRFVILSDGRIDSTRITTASTDDSTFIPVARQTLLQMRFWPACLGDSAVGSWVEQRFRYVHQ